MTKEGDDCGRAHKMDATYGRVFKQTLGEDDGGYASKKRFDQPFHDADNRYEQKDRRTQCTLGLLCTGGGLVYVLLGKSLTPFLLETDIERSKCDTELLKDIASATRLL